MLMSLVKTTLLHPSKEDTNGMDEYHTDSDEAENIYGSVDCINNDDMLDPHIGPIWAKIVNISWDCTKSYIIIILNAEWMLNRKLYLEAIKFFEFSPNLDCFASRTNCHIYH